MQVTGEEQVVLGQETAFFPSKSIADAEQPKMILCYKESTGDVVKDICVDCEGLQTNEVAKDVKSTNDLTVNDAGNLLKEGQEMSEKVDLTNTLKSTEVAQDVSVDEIVVEQPVSHQSPRRSAKKFSLADLFAEEREFVMEENPTSSPTDEINLGQTHKPVESQDLGPAPSSACDDTSIDQDVKVNQKEITEEKAASHLPEIVDSESRSYEKLLEGGSNIDLSVSEQLNLGKIVSNAGAVYPLIPEKERQRSSEIEQYPHVVAGSSNNRANEDLGLLGPSFLSGGIMYSGHLHYSGSVSLRSESSMTSNRSFAFPVLQSEWNSSPVKMAMVDRRQHRGSRHWHSGLFCCRF